MKTFRNSAGAVLLTCALGAGSAAAAPVNLIANSDFEAGATGFDSDYAFVTRIQNVSNVKVSPHINDAFSANPSRGSRGGDHTTGSGLALFVNGSQDSTSAFWRQTVATTPGAEYEFRAWGMIWFGGDVATALRVNGATVGTYTIDRFSALDVWAEDVLSFEATAPNSVLELVNLSTQFSGNDFAVDDLSLARMSASPVPLPAGAWLLIGGLGALGLLRRR
jgi:hypothetical protein